MSGPPIHGNRPVFSASSVLKAVGDELGLIRQQDNLTWADIGRVLGKGPDQAAKYADGSAEMGLFAYAAAKREWNGRFTGALDRLCHDSRPAAGDHHCQSRLLAAALALSVALEDGEISRDEVRANRATLENARDAIEAVLGKLAPHGAAA